MPLKAKRLMSKSSSRSQSLMVFFSLDDSYAGVRLYVDLALQIPSDTFFPGL